MIDTPWPHARHRARLERNVKFWEAQLRPAEAELKRAELGVEQVMEQASRARRELGDWDLFGGQGGEPNR